LALFQVEIIILVRQSVIVTILWAGRLKNRGRVPVRVEILSSAKSRDLLGGWGGGGIHPPSYSVGLRHFPNGICGRGLKLTINLSLEMSGTIPPLRHVLSYRAQGP